MREMYRCLTHDSSASHDIGEVVVDEWIQHILQLQDPDIVSDLRYLNEGRPEKYQVFWEYFKKFINVLQLMNVVMEKRHTLPVPCQFVT